MILTLLAAQAAVLVVDPTDPTASYSTIQDAIDGARHGDTVEVHASTYLESLRTSQDLTIVGVGQVLIEGGVRVGSQTVVRLENLEISGLATSCVDIGSEAFVEVVDVDFIGCTSQIDGGAIHGEDSSTVLVRDSTFDTCTALDDGGAIAIGTVHVLGSSFDRSNALDKGGAIYGRRETVLVRNTFARNSAAAGGAVHVAGNYAGFLDNRFESNTSLNRGGAALVAADIATLWFNHFCDNTATTTGGAAYFTDPEEVLVYNNELLENNAVGIGGFDLGNTGYAELANNNIVGHDATGVEMNTEGVFVGNAVTDNGVGLEAQNLFSFGNLYFRNTTDILGGQPGPNDLTEDPAWSNWPPVGNTACDVLPLVPAVDSPLLDGFTVPDGGLTLDIGATGLSPLSVDPDADGTPDFLDCGDDQVGALVLEICDNGVDDNCDGRVDEAPFDVSTAILAYVDADGDGVGAGAARLVCSVGQGYSLQGDDCNDADPDVQIATDEICNGIDDDCDGDVDEGFQTETYYPDLDGDGFGSLDSSAGLGPVTTCDEPPADYVADATDCNDNASGIHPGADERCNSLDDDCDGEADEGLDFVDYFEDLDGDGYGNGAVGLETCNGAPDGYVPDASDCNDDEPSVNPGRTEICNGVDDDCASGVDDGLAFVDYYEDGDGDGYGRTSSTTATCDGPPAGYALDPGDCNDGASAIHPGATEVCDGVDNNCMDGADEGLAQSTYFQDSDGDGYGDAAVPTSTCGDAPEGYVDADTDCDDTDDTRSPGQVDVCDGTDNDCSGVADDGPDVEFLTYYEDADGDGYGDPAVHVSTCDGPPDGYVLDDTDCDDTDASLDPGEDEICDGIDNDCDGLVDLADGITAFTYYIDLDDDGYGDAAAPLVTCDDQVPDGYADNADDCLDDPAVDPAAPNAFPGAVEVCDGIDNDCDMLVDSADTEFLAADWYLDVDGDGYGDPAASDTTCTPQPGWVNNAFDCDDSDPAIQPLATDDDCDGVDDNCNTLADEEAPVLLVFPDADGDGDGDANSSAEERQCPGDGYVDTANDCDDEDASVFDGAPDDQCDGTDNDCDGVTDEDAPFEPVTVDLDGDGHFVATDETAQCITSPPATDCDDSSADIHPDAPEQCGAIDHNCNGATGDAELGQECDPDDTGEPTPTADPTEAPPIWFCSTSSPRGGLLGLFATSLLLFVRRRTT